MTEIALAILASLVAAVVALWRRNASLAKQRDNAASEAKTQAKMRALEHEAATQDDAGLAGLISRRGL